jgi:adenosylcobinamide-phosphate synthase
MFGYRTAALREFGWASARLDDVANFIPARLSIFAITAGSFVCGRRWIRAFVVAIRDRRKHLSPNAGIPEAAFAGALGVSLGGPSSYGGSVVNRPRLGDPLREVRIEDIGEACMISVATALVFALPISALMVAIPLWH